MQYAADLLWNPFLCLLYLVVGVVFMAITGSVALRHSAGAFRRTWHAGDAGSGAHEIGHRDAFLSALAASVGVGNLAGVATALHLGGPGALFWMWVSALLGMSFRMGATYFAIKYRPQDPDSPAIATPMSYLEQLLPEGNAWVPRVVSVLLMVTGLVNANLVQSNSVAHALRNDLGVPNWIVGLVLSATAGVVIIGGVRSIVRLSARMAPIMLAAYVVVGLLVLLKDPARTLERLGWVFTYAFESHAAGGGAAGYVVLRSLQYGVSRGVFSHGSGIGMAPFFQSSNTDHPARGAFMAAVVPLVDTLVVCTITGLVILSNGFWQFWTSAYLTVSAFEAGAGPIGKWVVLSCLVVFAFTTLTSWAHFSERCFVYLGGQNRIAYRSVFCAVTFIGPFFPVALVWSFGDVLIGLLLLFHLLPLTHIMMAHRVELMEDLRVPTAPVPVSSDRAA